MSDIDREEMRQRLIKRHVSDREAMPPSMMVDPGSTVSYEEEAKLQVAKDYGDADLDLLDSIYQAVMQGAGQDSATPLTEEVGLDRALTIYKDSTSKTA